ncbi:MAG: hypothetical protein ACFFB3_09800 [Candidatus Hodarchaeota archaeon]
MTCMLKAGVKLMYEEDEYDEEDEIEEDIEDELRHPPPPPPPRAPPLPPTPPEPFFFEWHNREGRRGRVKNITIRGIDSEVYGEFSQQMKILGMTIGDAISKMMSDVLKDFDETFPDLSARSLRGRARLPKASISHHDELSIGAQDLIESNARMGFSHIGLIELEPDVTRDIFIRYVGYISHCERVRIPKVLPKLLVLSRVHHCEDIEIYHVEKSQEVTEEDISD